MLLKECVPNTYVECPSGQEPTYSYNVNDGTITPINDLKGTEHETQIFPASPNE